jgi:hypothetical protein
MIWTTFAARSSNCCSFSQAKRERDEALAQRVKERRTEDERAALRAQMASESAEKQVGCLLYTNILYTAYIQKYIYIKYMF